MDLFSVSMYPNPAFIYLFSFVFYTVLCPRAWYEKLIVTATSEKQTAA